MDVKPCPLCGNDQIYQGHTCAQSMGVICFDCHLELANPIPNEIIKVKTTMQEAIKDLEEKTLEEAIRMWNRRSKSQ